MREEINEAEVQTASASVGKANGLMKRIIGVLMVLVMAASVAAPAAVAGPIGRNAVAAAAVPVNLYSAAVSGTAFGMLGFDAVFLTPSIFLLLVPFPGHTLFAAAPVFVEAGTEGILAASELVRLSSLAPIVHATIWNGIDLALLNKAALDAIVTPIAVGATLYATVALGTIAATIPVATVSALAFNGTIGAAAVGTAVGAAALGAGALGAGALALGAPAALGAAGLGAATLGAAALGTTAVVGTGLALGAAALGAGALATTAAVGTTALVGTGIVAHHLLNNSDENSDEQTENTDNSENGTSSEGANAQSSEAAENAAPILAGETAQA